MTGGSEAPLLGALLPTLGVDCTVMCEAMGGFLNRCVQFGNAIIDLWRMSARVTKLRSVSLI